MDRTVPGGIASRVRPWLSLLLGYHPTIGAALLMIFLLAAAFVIHNFWTVQDQPAKLGEMINFPKNMAILGLLLLTLAIPRPLADESWSVMQELRTS